MRFDAARHLLQHVAADRLAEEGQPARRRDGDEPGQREEEHPDRAESRPQRRQPAKIAALDGQGERGERDEARPDRALDQDTEAERGPEQKGQPTAERRALPDIGARQHAERHRAGEEERGIRLGEPRLDPEHEAGGHHQPGEQRGARPAEGERHPPDGAGAADRGEERGQPIDPDRRRSAVPREMDGRRLQPVDADRLLVARLGLEADVEIVARLDHLLGRLREARLVAVGRRERHEAGQEGEEGDRRDEGEARRPRGGDRAEKPLDRLGEAADHARFGRGGHRSDRRHVVLARPGPPTRLTGKPAGRQHRTRAARGLRTPRRSGSTRPSPSVRRPY